MKSRSGVSPPPNPRSPPRPRGPDALAHIAGRASQRIPLPKAIATPVPGNRCVRIPTPAFRERESSAVCPRIDRTAFGFYISPYNEMEFR